METINGKAWQQQLPSDMSWAVSTSSQHTYKPRRDNSGAFFLADFSKQLLDELNHYGCRIQWDAGLVIGNPACMGIPVIFDVDCLPIDAGHSRCRFRHIRCRPVDDDIGSEQTTLSLVPAPPLPNRRPAASIFSNHAISDNVTLAATNPVSSTAPASGGGFP